MSNAIPTISPRIPAARHTTRTPLYYVYNYSKIGQSTDDRILNIYGVCLVADGMVWDGVFAGVDGS